LCAAIEFGFKIFEETQTFKGLGSTFTATSVPECTQHVFRSRAYWECYVKNYGFSGLHMTGTCSMGTVVDKELK